MASRYTVDFFIKKFRKIPESRWTVDKLHDGARHCALGHCGLNPDDIIDRSPMAKALNKLFYFHFGVEAPDINDQSKSISEKGIVEFPGFTPRQRILGALKKIKQIKQKSVK